MSAPHGMQGAQENGKGDNWLTVWDCVECR